MTDATGATVCETQTNAQGAYSCTLPAGTKAPLAIRASREDQVFYSAAAGAADIANVTPLTTVVVARISPNGNPASLAGALQSNPETVTADTLSRQVAALNAALRPVLDALGLPAANLLSEAMVADGTGQDKLLDSLSVTTRPDGKAANIEITVKTADGTPVSIRFRSDEASIPAVDSSVKVADVPAPNVVSDLFKRLADCYALPLTQRVSGASNDSDAAVGGPAEVIADVCRGLFLGDDPATFYSNGATVGRSSANRGAFASLFRGGATGLQWDQGNVEFFRGNGDMVLSYRTKDAQGNTTFETLGARKVDGKLKLVGNGYAYQAIVQPYEQLRDLLNTPAFSNYGTGYDVTIPNLTDNNGHPIFQKAVVTAPWGTQLTFLPSVGYSSLRFGKPNGTVTGSSVYRLRGEYESTSTAGNPAEKESSLTYAEPQYTDTQIAGLINQGVWSIEFFHADTTKSNVTQTTRTLSRALTVGELRQRPLARLSDGMRNFLKTGSANGYLLVDTPTWFNFSTQPDGQDGWIVPDGALQPTLLSVYGNAPYGSSTAGQNGAGFNDTTTFPSSARKAVVYCSAQTASDKHCDSADPTRYAKNSTLNAFQLLATNQRQMVFSTTVGVYKLQ
ncbi:carboxypeptidase regulatory-like domain-containing protein [Variovorax sp. GB1P17]|uniref:carboxypeptidase regulatory-like domain-containing protein n=1 Tax=Variovorax sp. GB1P17 TaxID=3443740 RepID=UPI003F44F813